VAEGGTYNVTVAAQPTGQICSVTNGDGSDIRAAVTDIGIVCEQIHAVVLSGAHLLFSPGSPQKVISAGTLSITVTPEAGYTRSDLVAGTCATGTWAGDTYTTGIITEDCTAIFSAAFNATVGGNISGLSGTVILAMNGVENLPISSNGNFTFSTSLPEGSAYSVAITTQPAGQTCSVTNDSGTTGGSNVANVAITCSINTYTVTPSAGPHGTVSPNSPALVTTGASQTFTATPDSGYLVNEWLVDGNVVQTGGTTYQLNGVQASHTVTVTFISAPPRFAYFGNFVGHDLIKCNMSAGSGAADSCGPTGSGFTNPVDIAINAAGTTAYVVNFGSATVSQCNVDFSTGELHTCTDAGATAIDRPISLTMNPAGTLVYMADLGTPGVTQCAIDPGTGALSGCVDSGASPLSAPQTVTFNAAGTIAYIPSYNAGLGVVKCSVDAGTGSLGPCASTGNGFSGPDGMDINASGDIAYVANYDNNTISKCSVDAIDGTLTGCASTGSGVFAPAAVQLNRAGTILYVNNANTNTASQCYIDAPTGDLIGCSDISATGLNTPVGIQLYY
jgi:6-phosphogluconolactonase (cycloisomerase 2 family)